jgi:outer membrane protein assembly factor BamB
MPKRARDFSSYDQSSGVVTRTMLARWCGPFIVVLGLAGMCDAADHWPQFRGPDGQGHASASGLPTEWSEQKNIVWRTPIPGEGWSSPVIFGDQIWMTTAEGNEEKSLRAVCVDRETGKLLRNVEVFSLAEPGTVNAKNTFASPTPVIEAGRLYVHFGTFGTACLSTETGKLLWTNRDLKLDHKEGPGSSPILYGDLLIFNCDGMDVQYVVALDKHSGRVVWKTDRSGPTAENPDLRKAYSTPLVITVDGQDQLISTGADRVIAYEPATGKEIWVVYYKGYSNVPRPVFGDGRLIISTGFTKPQLWAIRPQGRGDLTETNVLWRFLKQVPANPSPLLVGDEVYMVSDRGVATCIDAKTGEACWTERLGGNYSASPMFADGRVFIFSEDGKTFVLEPGRKYHVLATNQLDGRIMASPAMLGRTIYLRTDKYLYRIEKKS